jgi:hypothetical protein
MAAKTFRKSKSVIAAAVAAIRPRLAVWRQRRRHREAIPERLWRRIVPLARVHGVSPIAQALRLNYTALKNRMVAGPMGAAPGESAAGFVEASPVSWLAGPQYVLELQDRRGRKLTLQVARGGATELLVLAQGLWRDRA